MLDLLSSTFTASFILLSLAIAAITGVIKDAVKFRLPKIYASDWWNSATIMTLPVVIGALLTLFLTNFPYPEPYTGIGYRLMTGAASGLCSSWVFDFVKRALRNARQS